MLMHRTDSLLLVIDVQSRLAPHVLDHEALVDRCDWLLDLAGVLGVPTLVSEHCPKAIGETVPRLAARAADADRMRKVHFSCMAEPTCRERIEGYRRSQIVVAGMEAHVCVMQTVLDLAEAGFTVFVVRDATSSQRETDRAAAFGRMAIAGATIVTSEMVLFEWAERGDDERFRMLHRRFLKRADASSSPPSGAGVTPDH